MVWDFAEANPFGGSSGDAEEYVTLVSDTAWNKLARVSITLPESHPHLPPPIGSPVEDAHLRRSLPRTHPTTTTSATPTFGLLLCLVASITEKPVFPDSLLRLTVPKDEELIAASYRHGRELKADTFFLDGMTQAMHRLAEQAHPAFPVTIYYAFKQSEREERRRHR